MEAECMIHNFTDSLELFSSQSAKRLGLIQRSAVLNKEEEIAQGL